MSYRAPAISWSSISRARLDRVKLPTGFLAARTLAQGFARFRRRPLFAAGKFDRSAIMAAASYAADRLQADRGLPRREAMSIALKATWQAARAARFDAAH